MSVSFQSTSNEEIEMHLSNGVFAAIVAATRACGDSVPPWNGCHDGQQYTSEQIRWMAARAKQIGDCYEGLVHLADNGDATVN
jgi:hypothetical protein